jgi:hypothetical protein
VIHVPHVYAASEDNSTAGGSSLGAAHDRGKDKKTRTEPKTGSGALAHRIPHPRREKRTQHKWVTKNINTLINKHLEGSREILKSKIDGVKPSWEQKRTHQRKFSNDL